MMILSVYKSIWDKLSIGASIACAVHCVALPLVFTTLPLLGVELLENIYLELCTIAISLFIGGWAVWKGYRKHHRSKLLLVMFIAGILLLVAGNFVTTEAAEMVCKFTGAGLLITAHIVNWRKCKQCVLCNNYHPQAQS